MLRGMPHCVKSEEKGDLKPETKPDEAPAFKASQFDVCQLQRIKISLEISEYRDVKVAS